MWIHVLLMNKLNDNVILLLEKYGGLDDIKFCLLYWQQVNSVDINKETISTKDLIRKATNPKSILDAKRWIEYTREENE
jgi:hypothetical protein